MSTLKEYKLTKAYSLENGAIISNPTIAYHTYGSLNEDGSNVVWVCHALTANSDVMDWWKGLFGEENLFNPQEHFIVCANILGSHYGTTGPLSENDDTREVYYHNFPQITIRDMVGLHIELAKHLGVDSIHLLIGGSVGGHQALEWAIIEPDRMKQLCLVATSAVITPWAAAHNASQRMAIEADPTWANSSDKAGMEGMKVARSMALLSYRNFESYHQSQQQDAAHGLYQTKAASYQAYQGLKLSKRFNAFSYWHIAKAMDSHNVGRGRGSVVKALSTIRARTIVITIQDDVLFPLQDQEQIANHISGAEHLIINSIYGHDGFLLETKRLSDVLKAFLVYDQVLT